MDQDGPRRLRQGPRGSTCDVPRFGPIDRSGRAGFLVQMARALLSTLARDHPACCIGAGTHVLAWNCACRSRFGLCGCSCRRPAGVVQGGGDQGSDHLECGWGAENVQPAHKAARARLAPRVKPAVVTTTQHIDSCARDRCGREKFTSPGTQAPTTSGFLSLAPPSSSCWHAAGVRTILHRLFAMTTLRCTLLVVLLLNVVFFVVPGQASASSASERCWSDFQLCGKRGLRCRECRDGCMELSKISPPGFDIIRRDRSVFCNDMMIWWSTG